MSRLMNEWICESPSKDIAFNAIMVMSGLLSQKPSEKSKLKDHLTSLENRMKLWNAGQIMELLKEAETIQKDLRVSNIPSTIAKISKKSTRNTLQEGKYQLCDEAFSRQHAKWYSCIK